MSLLGPAGGIEPRSRRQAREFGLPRSGAASSGGYRPGLDQRAEPCSSSAGVARQRARRSPAASTWLTRSGHREARAHRGAHRAITSAAEARALADRGAAIAVGAPVGALSRRTGRSGSRARRGSRACRSPSRLASARRVRRTRRRCRRSLPRSSASPRGMLEAR